MKNFKKYGIYTKILYRVKIILNLLNSRWEEYLSLRMSRENAKRLRRRIIKENNRKIVTKEVLKKIKEYCKDNFGDESYWPWIALYTELRGDFMEGWMPDDYYRFKFLPKMNPEKFMRLSEAKTIDHKLFKGKIIPPIILYSNGNYYDEEYNYLNKNKCFEYIRSIGDEVILKPDSGYGGKSIKFIHPNDSLSKNLSLEYDFIVQKVVKQHHELNRLYPKSVNTFRVSTYLTNKGQIKVNFVILRFGIGGARIDNISKGGGWLFISTDGIINGMAYDNQGKTLGLKHPDTKTEFESLNFHFFDKMISLCTKAHSSFPFTRIIGWDVYVDEVGNPKIIEWNANNPSFWKAEALFGPFYKDTIILKE